MVLLILSGANSLLFICFRTTNVDDIDRECFLNINAAYVRLTSGDKNDELLEEQFHAAYSDSSLFEGLDAVRIQLFSTMWVFKTPAMSWSFHAHVNPTF